MEASNGSRNGQIEGKRRLRPQEMGRLKENDVYDLISRAAVPFNHKVIGTRWAYKVKSDFTFKSRRVVQGWPQRPGIDCGAMFAPVCRIESQRLLMAISTQHDWDIYFEVYARCKKRVSTQQNRRGSVRQARSRVRDTGSCNWNTHGHETQASCLRIEDSQPCLASCPGQGVEDHRLHLHEK